MGEIEVIKKKSIFFFFVYILHILNSKYMNNVHICTLTEIKITKTKHVRLYGTYTCVSVDHKT